MGLARTIALGVTLLLAVPVAYAQNKIGYVDWNAVLESAPQITEGRQRLNTEFGERNAKLERDEGRLTTLEQRLSSEGPLMSVEQVQNLEREVRTLRRNLSAERNELGEELDFRLKEVRQRVEQQISTVVRGYAIENGYDLIMLGPVLYASSSVDLTQQIIQQLQSDNSRSGDNG